MDYLDIHTHRADPCDGQRTVYNLPWPPVQYESIRDKWISIGLHPWYLTEANMEQQLAVLDSRLGDNHVKLLGECGFDRLQGPPLSVQRLAFERQLQLAVNHQKPVIIHCVRAFDELVECGKRFTKDIPLIVHGFNKSPAMGRQLLRHGFLLSFGASIMKADSGPAQLLRDIDTPFFLETDDSQLDIEDIYQRAAFLRNVVVDELKDIIFAAWKKINII